MRKYNIEEYVSSRNDEIEKDNIARQCLEIANSAQFPTDYQDVYDHLFEDDSYIRVFVKNEFDEIKGFAIICNENVLNNLNIMHVHGIIIHPEAQGLGLAKEVINTAVEKYQTDVVTAKTHNPRCFNMFADILNNGCDFYPNTQPIPSYIYEIVKKDKFIDKADEDLICRDAYPDVKIQQSKRKELVNDVFEKVGPYDAQAIVVVVNKNVKEKTIKPKNIIIKKTRRII